MTTKYSLVHLTNASCPPPEMVYTAARAGYDCVSFRGIPTRMKQRADNASVKESITGKMPFDFAGSRQLILDTKKASQDTGVILHDSENARIFDGGDVRYYEPDLEATAELGIRHILTNIWSEDKSFYTEQLEELCDLAKNYGLSVNVEFVTWAGVRNLKETSALLRSVNKSNVGIVLDMIHFYRSGVEAKDMDGLPESWFRYVHLCDCPEEIPGEKDELIRTGLEERLFPGEGAIDIAGIIRRIPQAVRGLEVPNPVRMEQMGFEAYIKAALRQTKQYLNREM